jgi:FKBP-type peptidyl-prolyl cis-trans isomerase
MPNYRRFRPTLQTLEDRAVPATAGEIFAAAAQAQANSAVIASVMRDFQWMAFPGVRPLVQQFTTNIYTQSISEMQMLSGGAYAMAANNAAFAQNVANWLGFPVVPPPPPLTVKINQAPTQADPTSGSPITFNVVFSTPVTGFTASDVKFTGSTAGGTLVATVTGTGAKYTVAVTGMTTTGTVVVSIPAASAVNARGVKNRASTSTDKTVTFDNTAPTVTINQGTSQFDPTTATTITFNVVFSENVTGFAGSDVSFTGSTAGGTLVANVTGSGKNYTVNVTGMTTDGTVVASIGAGSANDLAGNTSAASTSTDNTVTFTSTAPTDAGMTDTLPDKDAPDWVTLPSGLKTWDVVVGQGDAVQTGDSIQVFYTGWLLDGTVFDSKRSPATPASFALSGLIQGWQQGIPGMKPGGIRRLYVPSALGYGVNGSPPNIPANADLIFEIKLAATT